MRHRLTALTAACILALSLPNWAHAYGRDTQQRAQALVQSLPEDLRHQAWHALHVLQAQGAPTRYLPLNRRMQAAAQWIEYTWGHAIVAHALPPTQAQLPHLPGHPPVQAADVHLQWERTPQPLAQALGLLTEAGPELSAGSPELAASEDAA